MWPKKKEKKNAISILISSNINKKGKKEWEKITND